MHIRNQTWLLLFCFGGTTLFAGCQATPPVEHPFRAPASDAVQVTHFTGTPLSGPTLTKPTPIRAADAWSVSVRFVALEHMPADAGQPLAGRIRMLVQSRRALPVLPAERLLRGARWLDLNEKAGLDSVVSPTAGHLALIAQPQGALPANVTASFTLSDTTGLDDSGASAASHRRIEVDAYRSGSGDLQIGVALEDLADQAPDKTDLGEENKSSGASSEAKPQAALGRNANVPARSNAESSAAASVPPMFQRELAIIDLPPMSANGEQAAVLIPFHFTDTDAAAIAAVISVTPASNSPEHVATTARCEDDLQLAADAAANDPQALTVVSPQWSIFRVALGAMSNPDRRRSGLVYLATQTGAPLCRDVALAADGPTLDHLSGEIRRVISKPAAGVTPDGDELGWTLDRTTFQTLSTMLNSAKLPLELAAVLTSFTGQVGRDAGSVDEVSHSLGSRAQFMARLQAENLISLEDSSLAARVRAYDWLRARNQAPPGYDPQAARNERRDALEKFVSTPTTAPVGTVK